MPIIEHEGKEYEFPYDMPMEEIKAVMQQKFPPQIEQLEQPEQDRSVLEKAVNLGAAYTTGRTFGLGPKVGAGVGAPIAKGVLEVREALTGEESPSLVDLYKSGVELYQGPTEQAREDNPKLALLAELAGGAKSGVGVSKTATGQQVGRTLKSGGLGAKVGKGFGAGELAQRTYEASQAPVGEEAGILLDPTPGLGGILGGVAPAVGPALKGTAKALTPKIDESLADVAQLAQKHDIPLSIDQITGSRAVKNIQKISQEVPFAGQEAFREKQMAGFNKALLKTVGVDGDRFTKPTMDRAFKTLGKKFDNLGAGKTYTFDDSFVRSLSEIKDEAADTFGKDAIDNFDSFVVKMLKDADNAGNISGEKLNKLRARANAAARKTNNPDTNTLLHDVENLIVDLMTSGDDAAIKEFGKTKQQYKNLIAIEPLAAKAKAGNISPTLLNQRVSRIYGRQHTRGKSGEIGELAQIGHELLPELGGSDTAQKLLYAGGAVLGGGINAPITALTLGLNRAGQALVNRNQAIVNRAIKGANVTEDLMKLPPKDAQGLIELFKKNKITWKGK